MSRPRWSVSLDFDWLPLIKLTCRKRSPRRKIILHHTFALAGGNMCMPCWVCFLGCVVMDCGWLPLCCCAGPFPRCSLCCSHWGGLVVICLGLMLPALHSAPVGPRGGRPPSTTAETHTHIWKHTHPHRGFFSFSTRAKHKGRRPSHRFSFLCSGSLISPPFQSFLFLLVLPLCPLFLSPHTHMNYNMGNHASKIYVCLPLLC